MELRNRNKEIRTVRVGELEDHPSNFRRHPAEQAEALDAVVQQIGYYGYPDVYETPDGKLRLTDGHLRKAHLIAKYGADTEIEVNVTDFDAAEAKVALLTKDPLAALAESSAKELEALAGEVEFDSPALDKMIEDLADEAAADGGGTAKKKEDEEEIDLKPEYSVLVKCANESDQKAVLEELDRHGLETRALVVGFPQIEKKEQPAQAVEVTGLEIVREVAIARTGRVQQLEGMFDVPPSKASEIRWRLDFKLDRPWNIGLIVGPSGSGKSTVARELFGAKLVSGWDWPEEKAVVDGFPAGMSIVEITAVLSSVGFSSPPAWLKPFRVLSNGEQFRVNLARTLAESPGLAVVDEFTSVVDRTVAQVGSAAVAKAVRSTGRQFIAVSCHYDIEEWLQPDWKLELPSGKLTWRLLRRRPEIPLCIRRTNAAAWELFRHHHYLNHGLNRAAACFVATVNGRPAAFTAVLHAPHASGGYWREHRTVCLPDFQGVGIGNAMSEYIASLYVCKGKAYRSTTSHPAMIRHRLRSANWFCNRKPSFTAPQKAGKKRKQKAAAVVKDNAIYRLTASFEWIGPARPEEAARFGVV
jgi:ABC-type ATPase involved in cell division